MAEESESKAKLVREICSVASTFASCAHIRRPATARKAVFVDWYLILRVDEESGVDVIRRRYRQLALQLHPDKNGHPKADIAFKLISEAYACLSDKARRKSFDIDRRNNYCRECHRKPQQSKTHKQHKDSAHAKKKKPYSGLHALKEVQNRLREECRVIESFLRASEASRKESPIFDPSDRLMFPYYPCHRAQLSERQQGKDSWSWSFFHGGSVRSCRGFHGVRCESPIYQIRTEGRPGRTWSPGFGY